MIIRIVAFLVVSAICIPPLITAYKAIDNKKKLLIFICFLIIPLVLDTVVILILLNGILEKGILNQVWIMGTPLLITLWFAACSFVVTLNFRCLRYFAKSAS